MQTGVGVGSAQVSEVVLYSDDYKLTLAEMGAGRIRRLVEVWADRYERLGSREEVAFVFIFENMGEVMGVTLHHSHGRIDGYPEIPPRAPTDDGQWQAVSHFHVEFKPPRTATRLKYLAGSELGGDAFLNDVMPEEAAGRLRGVAR